MNRPIKFRAWDEETKSMARFHSPFIGDGGYLYWSQDSASPSAGWTDGTAIGRTIHLMQFTGLLDKNGKEIYEGDAITARNLDMPKVVRWFEEIPGYSFSPEQASKSEIIGNIYENPDLLTV